MRQVNTYVLMLIMICCWSLPVSAVTDSTITITEEQWEDVVEGVDYIETYRDTEDQDRDTDYSNIKAPQFNLGGLKYLFYFLVVGLVLFVIIKIGMNWNKNPMITKNKIDIESIEEIEEKMHEIDLEELLKEAISVGNYRIALRINFLIVIKLLSQRGDIVWAKEKTNWEYHREVKDKLVADKFSELIRNFEPIWYGERAVSFEEYTLLSSSYEDLKKELLPNE